MAIRLKVGSAAARVVCALWIALVLASSLLAQDTSVAFRRAEHLRRGIQFERMVRAGVRRERVHQGTF